MAADRMAERGSQTDPLFPVHLVCRYVAQAIGGHRQNALAYRTRLPRTQTGGRPWGLRRTQLAWLSSSCEFVYRGLWISHVGTALRLKKKSRSTKNTCRTRRLPPAWGSRRCSGTSHGPSLASASVWL